MVIDLMTNGFDERRITNDLPLLFATDNLHHWSCGREVVNETMTNAEKFKEVFGFDGSDDPVYWWWEEEYQKPEADIQHVGYDSDQLGREK